MKSMPDILRNLGDGPYSCSERSTGLEQEVQPPEDVPKVGQTLPLHSLRSQRSASRDHVGRRGSFRFRHCPPHLRWIAVATTVRSHLAIPTPIPFSGPQPSLPSSTSCGGRDSGGGYGGGGGGEGHHCHNHDSGGGGDSGNCSGGGTGMTTPTIGHGRGSAPWSSFYNPWINAINMWSDTSRPS
jgi:hypothetical protein